MNSKDLQKLHHRRTCKWKLKSIEVDQTRTYNILDCKSEIQSLKFKGYDMEYCPFCGGTIIYATRV